MKLKQNSIRAGAYTSMCTVEPLDSLNYQSGPLLSSEKNTIKIMVEQPAKRIRKNRKIHKR